MSLPFDSNTSTSSLNGDNVNPLNAELNPICHLLALLGAHHILHVIRLRVKGGNSIKLFLLLSFRRVLNVICSFLGNSSASEF